MANSHITFRGGLQRGIFILLTLFTLAAPGVTALQARENAYDVLGKALVPLARVLIASPKIEAHAVTATLVLDSATNLAPADVGDTLEIALQSPDKLRLHATVLGQSVTICRDGQQIWAVPGGQIEALIDAQSLPKPDPDFKLDRFRLPITEKQLVWLPVLFTVQDAGDEAVNGENCMVLDVTLMPDLAHSLKAGDYSARLWVKADYKVAKIELRRTSGWRAVISVKSAEFAPSLPPETWQPTHDESMDLLQLTPARYKQLLDAIAARWAAFKPQR
jgi:hypothetical protein